MSEKPLRHNPFEKLLGKSQEKTVAPEKKEKSEKEPQAQTLDLTGKLVDVPPAPGLLNFKTPSDNFIMSPEDRKLYDEEQRLRKIACVFSFADSTDKVVVFSPAVPVKSARLYLGDECIVDIKKHWDSGMSVDVPVEVVVKNPSAPWGEWVFRDDKPLKWVVEPENQETAA